MEKYPSRILYQGGINISDTEDFGFVCELSPLYDDRVFLFINPTLTEQDLIEALEWRERFMDRFLILNPQRTAKDIKEQLASYRKDPETILAEICSWKGKLDRRTDLKDAIGSAEMLHMNNSLGETKMTPESLFKLRQAWLSQEDLGNAPELSHTDKISDAIRGVISSLPDDEQTILDYIPHLFLVGYNISYFYDIRDKEQVAARGVDGAVGTHEIVSRDPLTHQEYYPANAAIYHTIYIGEVTRETIVEETTHAINAHVGFSKEKWDEAAKNDFVNYQSKAFFVEIAGDSWMDNPKYNKSLGNEALQELCEFYKKQISKGYKRDEILCDIIEKTPECGKLFAEYKMKESMLAEAYRTQKFDRAEVIRSGKIMPDISPFLPQAENLAAVRYETITISSKNERP